MNVIRILAVAPWSFAFVTLLCGVFTYDNISTTGLAAAFLMWVAASWPIWIDWRQRGSQCVLDWVLSSKRCFLGLGCGIGGCLVLGVITMASPGMEQAKTRIAAGGLAEARGEMVYEEISGLGYYAGSLGVAIGLVTCCAVACTQSGRSRLLNYSLAGFILSTAALSAVRFGRSLFAVTAVLALVSYLINIGHVPPAIRRSLVTLGTVVVAVLFAVGILREQATLDTARNLEAEVYEASGLRLGPLGEEMPVFLVEPALLAGHYFVSPFVGIANVLSTMPRVSGTSFAYNHLSVLSRRFIGEGTGEEGGGGFNAAIGWSPRVWMSALRGIIADFGYIGGVLFCIALGVAGAFALRENTRHPYWTPISSLYVAYIIFFFSNPLFVENQMQFALLMSVALIALRGVPLWQRWRVSSV